MSRYRRPLDAILPGDIYSAVNDFSASLARTRADVIVTTARKSTCFLDVLRQYGKFNPSCPVVSDRILDTDLEWIRNKKVAIVDDLVISGSTLRALRSRLLSAGAASVEVKAIAVDKEYWREDLIAIGEPVIALEHTRALVLSRRIIEILQTHPRPYNVDWPFFMPDGGRIENTAVLNMTRFRPRDLTTELQADWGVRDFAVDPTPSVVAALDESFGMPVSRIVDLVKLRVMTSKWLDRHRTVMYPIVTLGEMKKSSIAQMFEALVTGAGLSKERTGVMLRSFSTTSSQLRLVQYLLAYRLGRMWCTDLATLTNEPKPWTTSIRQQSYVFPEVLRVEIEQIASSATSTLESIGDWRQIQRCSNISRDNLPLDKGLTDGFELAQAQLTDQFLTMYHRREKKARQLMLRDGVKALDLPANKGTLARLTKGVTVGQLERLLQAYNPAQDAAVIRSVVTDFLDIAVDAGIAVPIIREGSGSAVRAYRHGEDVNFGETQMAAAAEFLRSVYDSSQVTALTKVTVEKLLIIMINFCIAEKIFHPWEDRLGAPGTAGVRYRQMGAVSYVDSVSLFRSREGTPVSKLLLWKGVIANSTGDQKGYSLGQKMLEAPLDPVQRRKIRTTARILGSVLRAKPGNENAGLGDEDLAVLVSCSTPANLMKALAAEVFLSRDDARSLEERIAGVQLQDQRTTSADQAVLLAVRRSNLRKCCVNGLMKWRSTRTGRIQSILVEGRQLLVDPTHVDLWENIIEAIAPGDIAQRDRAVDELTLKLASWLVYAEVAQRLAVAALMKNEILKNSKLSPSQIDSLESAASSELDSISLTLDKLVLPNTEVAARLAEWWIRNEDDIRANDGFLKALPYSVQLLGLCFRGADLLLDEAEARSARSGRTRPITEYTTAVLIRNFDAENSDFPSSVQQAVAFSIRHIKREDGDIRNMPTNHFASGWVILVGGTGAWRLACRLAATLLISGVDPIRFPVGVLQVPLADRIFVSKPQAEFYGKSFERRVSDALEHMGRSGARLSGISVMALAGRFDSASWSREIGTAHTDRGRVDTVRMKGVKRLSLDLQEEWEVAEFDVSVSTRRAVDLVVITILAVETSAVRGLLAGEGTVDPERDATGRRYHVGSFSSGDRRVSVALTQCADANQGAAMAAAVAALNRFQAKFVAVVGIGGGVNPKHRIGDVVIGDQVIFYDNRKVTPRGVDFSGVAHPVSVQVRHLVNEYQSSGSELNQKVRNGGTDYDVYFGGIGTGGAVIADQDSEIRVWLQQFNRKVYIVETETGGVSQFLYEGIGATNGAEVGLLAIRGISDQANVEKDDGHHRLAAENAARVLRDLSRYF